MRLEFGIELAQIETPRFAVEAVEGIGKLFTLATLILNVLEATKRVEIVFHGLNPEDPERKIGGFKEIIESAGARKPIRFTEGESARVSASSSYYQWLTVEMD
jgi:hypothetical protein